MDREKYNEFVKQHDELIKLVIEKADIYVQRTDLFPFGYESYHNIEEDGCLFTNEYVEFVVIEPPDRGGYIGSIYDAKISIEDLFSSNEDYEDKLLDLAIEKEKKEEEIKLEREKERAQEKEDRELQEYLRLSQKYGGRK